VGPPNKIRRKAMIRRKVTLREGNGNWAASAVAAVMRQAMSSFHGADNKTMKLFALKMHP
jgi:hypothetical protein